MLRKALFLWLAGCPRPLLALYRKDLCEVKTQHRMTLTMTPHDVSKISSIQIFCSIQPDIHRAQLPMGCKSFKFVESSFLLLKTGKSPDLENILTASAPCR